MLDQFLTKLTNGWMKIKGGYVLKLSNLFADLFDDVRMAMADGNRDDAGKGIKVALSFFVPEILHVPFDDHQRLFVVGQQAGSQILLTQSQHFFAAGAIVGSGLVIADREL